MAERIPRAGEFYRHFKNRLYQIVAVAEHSETGEAMVVYQAMYGDFKIYVRPLELFTGRVDRDKYPKVIQEYRFERVNPAELSDRSGREEERPVFKARGNERTETGKVPADETKAARRVLRKKTERVPAEETKGQERQREEDTWKKPVIGIQVMHGPLTDYEDYGEAEFVAAQEKVVIPRGGRAERAEDELWESLTDEALQAAEACGEEGLQGGDTVSPKFLDFLEARTYDAKAVILESLREELDDEMIDGLAMAVDVEIPAGSLDERYHQLEQCLKTMARYEDTRLR